MSSVRIADIQHCVGLYYGLSKADLLGPSHKRRLARPRQIAMALSRELTRQSTTRIGQLFGARDHATVIYATRQVRDLAARDPELREQLAMFRRVLGRLAATGVRATGGTNGQNPHHQA